MITLALFASGPAIALSWPIKTFSMLKTEYPSAFTLFYAFRRHGPLVLADLQVVQTRHIYESKKYVYPVSECFRRTVTEDQAQKHISNLNLDPQNLGSRFLEEEYRSINLDQVCTTRR